MIKWHMTYGPLTRWRRAMVILWLTVALVSACGRGDTASQAPEGAMGLLLVPQDERTAAPAVTGAGLVGGSIGILDYPGKVVVLNEFASWCIPCQKELPVLAAAQKAYPNVQFLGLDVKDDDEAALGFLAAEGATYPVIKDPAGDLLAQFTMNPTRGLPVTFFIDEQGRLAGRILGEVTSESLAAAIKSLT